MRGARLALLLAACIGGCSKDHPPPTAVPPPPAARVVPFPPARSDRVPLDSEIHADFDTDLDPATITANNVYLKIDESRYQAGLAWASDTRRLTVVPADPLEVGRTYTIEITPRVRRASGEPLFPAGWFWQFSTTSIRAFRYSDPPSGATGQSPFMRLIWNTTETSAGQVLYRVFWGSDSNAVLERRSANADAGSRWIPTARWADGTTYWAVRGTNLRTGEVAEGPLWRFDIIPFGSPTQQSTLAAITWGSASSTLSPRCNDAILPTSQVAIAAIQWALPPRGLRLNVAQWDVTLFPNIDAKMTLRATRQWTGCVIRYPGTPIAIGPVLATARRNSTFYTFQSDTLTAFVEAAARDRDLYGFVIEVSRNVTFVTNNPTDATLGGMLMRSYPAQLFPETVSSGALRDAAGPRSP